jgi:cytochrome c oxidase assembly protein subunit 15
MQFFRKLAVVATAATILLIAIGGLVRATKSGLGCGTDWPHCAGKLVPALETRAEIIEFSHRAAASIVVVLLGLLAVTAFRNRKAYPRFLAPSVGAFGLVMFQAVLGAIVVKLELEAESVVLHLATALSLLALLVYIVALSTAAEGALREPVDRGISKMAKRAAGAVFLLLLVGSYVSGYEGAGRAFSDWPLMDGKLIPDLAIEEKAIHFFHRGLAAIVGAIVLVTALSVIRRKAELPLSATLAHATIGLFAIEVLIGAANVWTDLNSAFVTAHLFIGALIWAGLVGIVAVTAPGVRARAEGRTAKSPIPVEQGA